MTTGARVSITKMRIVSFPLLFAAMALTAPKTFSQISQNKTETLIRRLDVEAAKAVLDKDEIAIARFFTPDSVTNNPRNGLTLGSRGVIEAAKTGLIDYYSFDRVVESVQVFGNTAIVMGHETVIMKNKAGGAGDELRRRYTNIWMKRGKRWAIVARHANVICR